MNSELIGSLPHASSMLLLDRLISSNDCSVVVEATIKNDYPFSIGGAGSWIGLELMAQSAAVMSRLRNSEKSTKPSIGFLLGSRSFIAHVPEFTPGQKVTIVVQIDPESLAQSTISASGTIKDDSGCLICEGTLTLLEPNDDALYLPK
jgi:predicted hotdog family 3-hydroxylacyl-ACP dehydratase